MKDCNTILFDLDGTLINSCPVIGRFLKKTFGALGIKYEGDYSIFIGPPFKTAFPEHLGISVELTDRACELYRELYETEDGTSELKLFDGAAEALRALHEAGRTLCIVTSKFDEHAKIVLEHTGIDGYISALYGASADASRSHKNDVMEYALKSGGYDPADCVMVGDRFYDLNAASLFNVRSIGVLHGYGSLEEIEACSPSAIAKDLEEVVRILL